MNNVIERTSSFAPSGLSQRPLFPRLTPALFLRRFAAGGEQAAPLARIDIHNFVTTLKH